MIKVQARVLVKLNDHIVRRIDIQPMIKMTNQTYKENEIEQVWPMLGINNSLVLIKLKRMQANLSDEL